VEGSAVRPAVLSNPSWEATRMSNPIHLATALRQRI
jgi:hypothetical protein